MTTAEAMMTPEESRDTAPQSKFDEIWAQGDESAAFRSLPKNDKSHTFACNASNYDEMLKAHLEAQRVASEKRFAEAEERRGPYTLPAWMTD